MITVLKSVRPLGIFLAALTGVAGELCALGLSAAAAWLIARAADQPPVAALTLAIVAVRGFAIFRGVFRYAERLTGHDATLRAVAESRSRVYDALLTQPPTAQPSTAQPPTAQPPTARRDFRSGAALTRMVSDVDAIQDVLLRCLIPAGIAATTGIAAVGLFLTILPMAALILLAGLFLTGVVIPVLITVISHRLGVRTATARADLATRTLDLADGARDLASFGATTQAHRGALTSTAHLAAIERSATLLTSLSTGAGIAIQGATALAILTTAINSGTTEIVAAVLTLVTLAAFEPTLPLGEAARTYAELRQPLTRVSELLREKSTNSDTPSIRRGSQDGSIRLREVRLSYPPETPTGRRIPALTGIDLIIEQGTSVAVVGASGAGKSTLLAAIAGHLAPEGGIISAPKSRALTHDAHIFGTTIRENLTLAKPHATDADLTKAATTAHLLADIEELSDNWRTVVTSGGRELSGGQRRRLTLARTLLADPPVLLLDEPGESVEFTLADAILTDIIASRRGRTTVVVTHRLAALETIAFDTILVLDGGRIVQRGTHPELLAHDGPYRDLWTAESLVG